MRDQKLNGNVKKRETDEREVKTTKKNVSRHLCAAQFDHKRMKRFYFLWMGSNKELIDSIEVLLLCYIVDAAAVGASAIIDFTLQIFHFKEFPNHVSPNVKKTNEKKMINSFVRH